ncbi:MAG: hypothetical protein N3A62_05885 [Thermodesulfovibrionales bacterium]|nr:hypothetical protein [Thermodesulfovibrionales bacterium]
MMRAFFLLVLFLFFLTTSAGAINLDTVEVKETEIQGMFDIILYGARHGDDLETVALLVPLNSEYQVKMYAPDFDYRIDRAKDAKTATNIAKQFTSWHHSFMRHIYLKIVAPDGKAVAYEVRPLYLPFVYGRADVLDNTYRLKEKTVFISVKLLPSVERRLYHFDFDKSSQ